MDDSPDQGDDPEDRNTSGADADGSDEPAEGEIPADGPENGEDTSDSDDAPPEPGSPDDASTESESPDDTATESESTEDVPDEDYTTEGFISEDAADGDAEESAVATDDSGTDSEDVEEEDSEEPENGDAEGVDDADSADAEDTDSEPVVDTSETSGTTVTETDDIEFEGPESDEEMPLADHIEEMVRRLAIVLGVAGVVTLIAYPASSYLIEFLWQSYIPDPDFNRPHIYGPLEYILTKLKVAGISGTIVGLPVFVYQSYRFMKPGLYSQERRYYLASVPTSLVLALIGVVFAHLVILPLTMVYFTSYTADAAVVAFGLQETFNLIVVMMGYMAIVFQIPLFIMLAIMMGLVSREWMEDKRILFWGAFGGLAFTFVSVDPTGMAPIIIAVTMIVLFEGTLLLLRWTGN